MKIGKVVFCFLFGTGSGWLFGDLMGRVGGSLSQEIKTIVIFFLVCRGCFMAIINIRFLFQYISI